MSTSAFECAFGHCDRHRYTVGNWGTIRVQLANTYSSVFVIAARSSAISLPNLLLFGFSGRAVHTGDIPPQFQFTCVTGNACDACLVVLVVVGSFQIFIPQERRCRKNTEKIIRSSEPQKLQKTRLRGVIVKDERIIT